MSCGRTHYHVAAAPVKCRSSSVTAAELHFSNARRRTCLAPLTSCECPLKQQGRFGIGLAVFVNCLGSMVARSKLKAMGRVGEANSSSHFQRSRIRVPTSSMPRLGTRLHTRWPKAQAWSCTSWEGADVAQQHSRRGRRSANHFYHSTQFFRTC